MTRINESAELSGSAPIRAGWRLAARWLPLAILVAGGILGDSLWAQPNVGGRRRAPPAVSPSSTGWQTGGNTGPGVVAAPVFCTRCGQRAAPGDRFCAKCGAKLRQPVAPAPEPVPVEPDPDGADEVVDPAQPVADDNTTPVDPHLGAPDPAVPAAPPAGAPAAEGTSLPPMGDPSFAGLRDRVQRLFDLRPAQYLPVYQSIKSELDGSYASALNRETPLGTRALAPVLIKHLVFDVLMPEYHKVSNGDFSDYLSHDQFGASFEQSFGGEGKFTNQMRQLIVQVFMSLVARHAEFSQYRMAQILTGGVQINEEKEKQGGKTVRRSLRLTTDVDLTSFAKIYVMVIGAPNKDGSRCNEATLLPVDPRTLVLPNVNVYGTGIVHAVVGLR